MHLLRSFNLVLVIKQEENFDDTIAFPGGDFNYMLPPSSPPHVYYNKIPASTTTTTNNYQF